MGVGPSVFTKTIATGDTVTGEYDLGEGWKTMYLVVPTMSSYCITATCNIYVQVSPTSGGTFRRIGFPEVATTTTGIYDFALPNDVATQVVLIPGGYRYMKVEAGNTMSAGVEFDVICSD